MTKQDYQTPPEFIAAVEARFGQITFDLAAHEGNVQQRLPGGIKSLLYFDEAKDSLKQNWADPMLGSVRWCNPPFKNIAPWAAKCADSMYLPKWTLLLVPASIGSSWFAKYVLGKAMVEGIPRLTFVGTDAPFPKDLMLCSFGFGVSGSGYWDWRKQVAA